MRIALVHSEGDGLSGLVVDRFGDTMVARVFLRRHVPAARPDQATCCCSIFPRREFYWFAEEHVQKQERFDLRASPAPPPPGVINEHGVQFRAAPGSKHKTGFFLDQRDNRLLLAAFCAGKRVLDLCCNSGGFARLCQGARRRGGSRRRRPGRGDPRHRRSRTQRLNQARVQFVQADLFAWLRDTASNPASRTSTWWSSIRPRDARPRGGRSRR